MNLWSRLARVLVAGAVAAVSLVALAAPAEARAQNFTVDYDCRPTLFGIQYVPAAPQSFTVNVSVPDTVVAGDPIAIDFDITGTPTNGPIALGNVVTEFQPTVVVTRAGSPFAIGSGTGPASAPTSVPAYGAFPLVDPVTLSAPTFGAGGGDRLVIRPGDFTLSIVSGDDSIAGGYVSCSLVNEPSASTFVDVTGAPVADTPYKCTAEQGNTSGNGCDTTQSVVFDLLEGNLTQLAVKTGTNPDATLVDLGSITTPFVSSTLTGDLNTIQVQDNRGGSFGWSLSATMTDFAAVGGATMDNGQLVVAPSCTDASTIYDYTAYVDSTLIPPVLGPVSAASQAPGIAAGTAGQDLGGTVTLCTKNTDTNATTQSSGGVYDVAVPLTLTVPAFQSADTDYTATMTITLVG